MQTLIEKKLHKVFKYEQAEVLVEVLKEHLPSKEDFNELRNIVQELAVAQKQTDERVQELAVSQGELAVAQGKTEKELKNLAKQVGGLSQNFGLTLEDMAIKILPAYIEKYYHLKGVKFQGRQFIEVENKKHVEINLYGKATKNNKDIILIGEVKTNITGNEMEKYIKILKMIDKKFKGKKELFKLFFGYTIHPSAEKLADKHNIKLIATYNLIH